MYPHLSWVAMAGEGKRDYPASIGYQAPWYKEYHYIEDHFARLNTALTKGTPHVDVAVIHPIESYWLYWGNRRQTAGKRESIESGFENVIKWLLFGLIDFDFVSEAILSEESVEQDDNSFDVGKMKYHAVVVPGCETLRKNTYERLRAFGEAGGKIVFMGKIPSMIDCVKTDLVKSHFLKHWRNKEQLILRLQLLMMSRHRWLKRKWAAGQVTCFTRCVMTGMLAGCLSAMFIRRRIRT